MPNGSLPKLVRWVTAALALLWLVVGALAIKQAWEWPLSAGMAWMVVIVSVVLLALVLFVTGSGMAALQTGRFWALAFTVSAATVAVTLVAVGLYKRSTGHGTEPPPVSITNPTAADQFRAVLDYARRLDYDGTTHGAWDEQWLEVKRDGQVLLGPRARIEPERASYLNSVDDLTGVGRGRGRVVARVWVDTAAWGPDRQRGYPKLGLPPGRSFLWIDSMLIHAKLPDGDSGSARVLIIPDDTTSSVRENLVRAVYRAHRPRWANYSQARWRFDPNDPCANPTCPHGCCDHCDFQLSGARVVPTGESPR